MVSYDVSMIIHAVSRVDITMVSVDLPRVGARSQGLAAKSGKQTLRRWKIHRQWEKLKDCPPTWTGESFADSKVICELFKGGSMLIPSAQY